MIFQLVCSLLCVAIAQSQLSKDEWQQRFFYGQTLNKSEEKNFASPTAKSDNITLTQLINFNNKTRKWRKETQNIATTSATTLKTISHPARKSSQSTISVSVPPSFLQHNNSPERYSSMTFSDFITMSGIGEKSLTALLCKFIYFY